MAEARPSKEEYISRLKEERIKKEQGLDYSIPNIHGEENKISAVRDVTGPYVRKITLDELIDISRAKQNKPPVERAKLTPFIEREKEKDTPSLGKK